MTLTQSGTNNGVFNSDVGQDASPISQDVIDQSASQSAVTLTQTGSNNIFGIDQGGANNRIVVKQSDVGNEARASQGEGSFLRHHHDHTERQYHRPGNYADLAQTSGANSLTTLTQTGSANWAQSAQSGNASTISLVQKGINNTIFGTQDASSQHGCGESGTTPARRTASTAISLISRRAAATGKLDHPEPDRQRIRLRQPDRQWQHTITSSQIGDGNNLNSAGQLGNGNTIINTQTGSSHTLGVASGGNMQVGDNNRITNTQNGYYQTAYVQQTGNGNAIGIIQDNSGFSSAWNNISITQGSAAQPVVQQPRSTPTRSADMIP